MKKIQLFLICIFLIICMSLTSCGGVIDKEGLDYFYENNTGISQYSVTRNNFLTPEFLDQFPYLDGDFHYREESENFIFGPTLERSFAWIKYDADQYDQAKESWLAGKKMNEESVDGQTAYGFTFNLIYAYQYPKWIFLFGNNDVTQTLVFMGFYISNDHNDFDNCSLVETDIGAFLQKFYGDWYDWHYEGELNS